jgi:ABC-type polysaccharide/polyol phosphate transport system ATPase subunit
MMAMVQAAGIFVIATHDLELVRRVCSRAIWLSAGRIVVDGPIDIVLPEYSSHMAGR